MARLADAGVMAFALPRADFGKLIADETENTRAKVVDALNKEINAALDDAKIKARLAAFGGIGLQSRWRTAYVGFAKQERF
jgi:hypothetical protein